MATDIPSETRAIITRYEAKKRGLAHYFTGKPCPHGHLAERSVTYKECMECSRIRSQKRYWNDPAKDNARRKATRHADPEKAREASRKASEANRTKNEQKVYEYNRAWNLAHPETVKAARLRWEERHKQRLQDDPDYADIWREKNKQKQRKFREKKAARPRPDHCELCGKQSEEICFDHCHQTNSFRGWLCHQCNQALGLANDSPELLHKMAQYLEQQKLANDESPDLLRRMAQYLEQHNGKLIE
jgi:hypothetical protein